MYQILFIGFINFIIIQSQSTSDTTYDYTTDPSVTPQSLDSGFPTKAIDNVLPTKNSTEYIVNYEDLQSLIDLSCYPPSFDLKLIGHRIGMYENARANVRSTYDSMIMNKDTQIPCANKTADFKKSVDEFINLGKHITDMHFKLADEVMEAIINSVCHPEDFYENFTSDTGANERACFNIIRLLFTRIVKSNIGTGPIRRAYLKLRHTSDTITPCHKRVADFNKTVEEFVKIQKKYYNDVTPNIQVWRAVTDFVCHKEYKDFYDKESTEFEERSKTCHDMFGKEVSLIPTSTPASNNNDDTIDIVKLLFMPLDKFDTSFIHTKKENYHKCLMQSTNTKDLFNTLSSLILPVSNATTIPPVRKGPIWIYLLIAIIILLCGLGAVIIYRHKNQEEGLIEFELKPAQKEQTKEEKSDIKY